MSLPNDAPSVKPAQGEGDPASPVVPDTPPPTTSVGETDPPSVLEQELEKQLSESPTRRSPFKDFISASQSGPTHDPVSAEPAAPAVSVANPSDTASPAADAQHHATESLPAESQEKKVRSVKQHQKKNQLPPQLRQCNQQRRVNQRRRSGKTLFHVPPRNPVLKPLPAMLFLFQQGHQRHMDHAQQTHQGPPLHPMKQRISSQHPSPQLRTSYERKS